MSKIKKFILKEIEKINALDKTQRVKVHNGTNIINKSGYLKKSKPKGFILDIAAKNYWRLNVGDRINTSVSNKNLNIKITNGYVKGVGLSVTTSESKHSSQLHIHSFRNKGFRKKSKQYFRCVIPLKTKISFFNMIEDESFDYEGYSSSGLVSISFDNKDFHAFIVEQSKRKYLFIDCLDSVLLNDFLELAWEVSVAFGYLLGNLAQDEEYIFAYSNKAMKNFIGFVYEEQRSSIKSFYTPINANPYSWVKVRSIADSYYGKIKKVNSSQLSKLCDIMHKEQDIKAIIILITESLSRSLLLMPAGLSVALEGLSEYFYIKEAGRLNPIKDKKIASAFLKELQEVLCRFKIEEKLSGADVIKTKIENINSPTNRERLKAPFTCQNIPLTDIDEEILEYRNDFLHGNINLKPQKGKKSYSMDSFEISLRLVTLLNMCIMKMIGYEGYIINHVKAQENSKKKKINEDYYRTI